MKKWLTVLAFGIACSYASTASAASITFTGVGKNDIVKIYTPGFLGGVLTHAGELNWAWVGTPPSGYDASFYAYCVDANQYLRGTQTVTLESTDTLTTPYVAEAGKKVAWLFNTYAPGIHASGSGLDAASLQVAIWATLYNPWKPTLTEMLSGPNFTLDASYNAPNTALIAAEAQTYLGGLFLPGGGYNTSAASWVNTGLNPGQDQMLPSPVPEPGSMLLCGTGLASMACALRRRRLRSRGNARI